MYTYEPHRGGGADHMMNVGMGMTRIHVYTTLYMNGLFVFLYLNQIGIFRTRTVEYTP